ncbi:hypothetical protein SEA_BEAVER_91 [Gordonia phage Beaver]|uniref:Uncharacterized protein n=1 Tax=Gordonia phage Beaver TaxID=2591111 RepID=A0A515MJR1_9CAUD|nr:hypothetical protein HWC39_gp043 [Gordonia phage Beaver]QDM56905.1 hypothetical protein SEA_BEAVER_91 [Gordonia phage Beaver]
MRLVEAHEPITRDMFMRPLYAEHENRNLDKGWADEPINSFLWLPVWSRLGPYWIGKPLGEYLQSGTLYAGAPGEWAEVPSHEFAVDVPKSHTMYWAKEVFAP